MQHFKKTILPNGLRVIMVQKPDSLASTVLVLVEAGSEYETKETSGLSHFLEHMCFKGTKKRPKSIDISGTLDGIGAEYNAFTSQEWTGYYAKAETKHLDLILDVVSDIYLNPTFDLKEIDKERGVIIEEINMYEDNPPRRVQELFSQLLYGDQPAGWDVGGRKEVIHKLTREDFIKYRSKNYLAQATTVVVVGSFKEAELLKKIEDHFAGMGRTLKAVKPKTKEKQAKPEILVKHKKSDQTHLVLGVRAFDTFDERRYALQVLANILGGGMSSRLFQKVREELGAAYYVRASVDLALDHGFLETSAGVHHEKAKEVIAAILGELKRLAKEPISKEELTRAKDHLVGGLVLGLETSDAVAMYYGEQEVMKKALLTPEEIMSKIQAVTAKQIQEVAKGIVKNKNLNLAMIGPFEKADEFKKILTF